MEARTESSQSGGRQFRSGSIGEEIVVVKRVRKGGNVFRGKRLQGRGGSVKGYDGALPFIIILLVLAISTLLIWLIGVVAAIGGVVFFVPALIIQVVLMYKYHRIGWKVFRSRGKGKARLRPRRPRTKMGKFLLELFYAVTTAMVPSLLFFIPLSAVVLAITTPIGFGAGAIIYIIVMMIYLKSSGYYIAKVYDSIGRYVP